MLPLIIEYNGGSHLTQMDLNNSWPSFLLTVDDFGPKLIHTTNFESFGNLNEDIFISEILNLGVALSATLGGGNRPVGGLTVISSSNRFMARIITIPIRNNEQWFFWLLFVPFHLQIDYSKMFVFEGKIMKYVQYLLHKGLSLYEISLRLYETITRLFQGDIIETEGIFEQLLVGASE